MLDARPDAPSTAGAAGPGPIVAGNVGNVLEWYDFVVFAFLAPSIAQQFFPSTDPLAGLIKTFGVFAVGYLVRPLGACVIGPIGDRLGRKAALQLSMALMAVPTTLMAMLPGHATLGVFAPVLLMVLRLAQGLSIGGEVAGSMCYLVEVAPPRRRALFGSFTILGIAAGVLLASAIVALTRGALSTRAFEAWGWRVPFLGGLGIGSIGWWIRRRLAETAEFANAVKAGRTARAPLVTVLREQWPSLLQIFGMTALIAAGFYTLFVWMPTYQTHIVRPPVAHALLINSGTMLVLIAAMLLAGATSDRVGSRRVLLVSAVAYALAAVPLFRWIDTGRAGKVIAAMAILAVVHAGFNGSLPAAVVDLLPTHLRFTGLAVAYNLALAVFGGTAPLVATWLIASTGDLAAPAWYLAALAVVGAAVTAVATRPAPR